MIRESESRKDSHIIRDRAQHISLYPFCPPVKVHYSFRNRSDLVGLILANFSSDSQVESSAMYPTYLWLYFCEPPCVFSV